MQRCRKSTREAPSSRNAGREWGENWATKQQSSEWQLLLYFTVGTGGRGEFGGATHFQPRQLKSQNHTHTHTQSPPPPCPFPSKPFKVSTVTLHESL